MSENVPTAAGETQELPVLDHYECRILGVLVEKSKTTPDAYPLSLNSLTTGCNQKSNRDPVMNLDEAEIEDTLEGLQKKGLVLRITGSGRVERWRHNLYDAWNVGKVELAILAELLLRGAQTMGELRSRASRMEEIADLDELRERLDKLAQRQMVVWLSPPGQRGARVTHGFHSPAELAKLKQREGEPISAGQVAFPGKVSSIDEERVAKLEETLTQANSEIADLRSQIAALQSGLAALAEDFKKLKEELGG